MWCKRRCVLTVSRPPTHPPTRLFSMCSGHHTSRLSHLKRRIATTPDPRLGH